MNRFGKKKIEAVELWFLVSAAEDIARFEKRG